MYFVKGALEKILPQCTKYYENGQVYPLSQKKDQEFLTEAYEIGQQGLRGIVVLATIRIVKSFSFTFIDI
jgi:Ca2+-transporting ATPase